METIRTALFYVAGVVSLVIQLFGEMIILVLVGIAFNIWLQPFILLTCYYLIHTWKHYHYKALGHKNTGLTRYK